jgi:dihydrofolate reductase
MICIVAAMAHARVIGQGNTLPWSLPPDLKRFKNLTNGHPIIMGRKTFESIGRLLPGRTTIIVTRQQDFKVDGAIIAHSLEHALQTARAQQGADQIFICGGGQLYTQAIEQNLVEKIFLTHIELDVEGDAFFPELPTQHWLSLKKDFYPATDSTPAFLFEELVRHTLPSS